MRKPKSDKQINNFVDAKLWSVDQWSDTAWGSFEADNLVRSFKSICRHAAWTRLGSEWV